MTNIFLDGHDILYLGDLDDEPGTERYEHHPRCIKCETEGPPVQAPSGELATAVRIAAVKHGWTDDKSAQPFVGHPLRVMAAYAARYPDCEEWELAACVLHDVLEDTGTHEFELAVEGISERTIQVVKALSRDKATQTYFDYIAVVAEDRVASQIKLVDMADNMNPKRAAHGQLKLPTRYLKASRILKDRLGIEGR